MLEHWYPENVKVGDLIKIVALNSGCFLHTYGIVLEVGRCCLIWCMKTQSCYEFDGGFEVL